MVKNKAFIAGAILGMTGVMIGAFGAHGLKSMLDATGRMEVFETAVRYQMFHALLLLIIGLLASNNCTKALSFAFWLTLVGVLIFSLSLYALCLLDMPKLGMVTPFGGASMIAGWGALLIYFLKKEA
jgi:uncharacterized membrane protein YgdD (TMEM256/DUF423 family)